MTDIVDALRVGNVTIAMPDGAIKQVNHVAADEIERLREALMQMIQHVQHMVAEAEEAAKVDIKFIRNRLKKARAALGEGN